MGGSAASFANAARKAQRLFQGAGATMAGVKGKNPGALLGGLANLAGSAAGFAANSAGRFADTMAKAADRLGQGAALAPGSAGPDYGMGVALHEVGQIEPAAASFRSALAKDPRHGHSLVALGVILAKQGQYEQATRCFHKAAILDPDDPQARFWLAVGLVARGDIEDARRRFEELARSLPDEPLFSAILGGLPS